MNEETMARVGPQRHRKKNIIIKQGFNKLWVVFRRKGWMSPPDRSRHRWENIIKADLEKVCVRDFYIGFLQLGTSSSC